MAFTIASQKVVSCQFSFGAVSATAFPSKRAVVIPCNWDLGGLVLYICLPRDYFGTVYNMCNIDPKYNYFRELSNKYKEICEEYIISKVLPSLRGKKDDLLLRELLKRWSDYKVMTGRLSFIFNYLNQYVRSLMHTSLEEINFLSFNHGVYEKMTEEILNAIFSMIDRKLAGEMIDPTFVINTLDFYIKFCQCTEKDKAQVISVKLSSYCIM
ncbi:hypothetical protein RYX36_000705 [Vicia faba]